MQIHSYGKVWALGHMMAEGLLDGPVVIQEKIDGSQFSFGNLNGELHARSKSAQVGVGENCEGMFKRAWNTADLVFRTGTLPEGMVVCGECLDKPKHNTLRYNRVPTGNFIIWDVTEQDGSEKYLPVPRVQELAKQWGLECSPTFYQGELLRSGLEKLWEDLQKKESILGGTAIEGIVIKNYAKVDGMGKMLCGKIVRPEFKEANSAEWTGKQPGSVIERIIDSFNKEAIWQKAIQHAKEDGKLFGEAKDIGYLIPAVKKDFGIENSDEIKKKLAKEFYPDIERAILKGFPEFYKQRLLQEALKERTDDSSSQEG